MRCCHFAALHLQLFEKKRLNFLSNLMQVKKICMYLFMFVLIRNPATFGSSILHSQFNTALEFGFMLFIVMDRGSASDSSYFHVRQFPTLEFRFVSFHWCHFTAFFYCAWVSRSISNCCVTTFFFITTLHRAQWIVHCPWSRL